MAYFEVNKKPRLTFPTLTGSIVTFNAQYALPLYSHTIALTATQSGSGTPSPQNIRNINGYDSIIIGNCDNDIAYLWTVDSSFTGAVLFNQIYNYTSGSITRLGVVRTISSGLIYFSGESTSAGNSVTFAWTDFTVTNGHKVIVLKDFTLPEGDYIFDQYNGYGNVDITNTIMNISAGFMIPQLKVSGAGHDYTGISGHLSVIDLTVMFGATIADYIYNLEQSESGAGVAFFKHMYPDNYYPYNAGTKEGVGVSTVISIGSTVYGGEYDARTGVLTVTHGIVTYDSNNVPFMQIGTISGGVKTRVFIRQSGVSQTVSGVPNILCNIANPVEVNAQYQGSEGISIRVNANVNNQGFYIYDEDIQTLTEWQDYINNNSITVVYPLATPTTIQLPPCPIDTIANSVNNIWADTGDTTLQYPKFG